MAKSRALAADDHFDSEDTPDASDSLLQMSTNTKRVKAIAAAKLRQGPELSDEFEYGDKERALSQDDSSDFSLHQFVAEDDGREGTSTSNDDSGESEMVKSKALAADDHFNSEDTPDASDSFLQKSSRAKKINAVVVAQLRQDPESLGDYEYGDRESAVSQGDSSDFSLHQFLTEDDGRVGTSTNNDDSGEAEMAKSKALAADDHFDSEDTPDNSDTFLETGKKTRKIRVNTTAKLRQSPADLFDSFEYGDREMAMGQGDSSDFSMHQFLTNDDGREGTPTNNDDSGTIEIARAKVLAADDHFNSEDTPDNTDSFSQTNVVGFHQKSR